MSLDLMEMVFCTDLKLADRSVLLVIACAINDERPKAGAWNGLQSLAERSGCNRATVVRACERLEKAGILTIDRQPGHSNRYQIDELRLAELMRPRREFTRQQYTHSHSECDGEPVAESDPLHGATSSKELSTGEINTRRNDVENPSHCAENPSLSRENPSLSRREPVALCDPESELESKENLKESKGESKNVFQLLKNGETPKPENLTSNPLAKPPARKPEETDAERIARLEKEKRRQRKLRAAWTKGVDLSPQAKRNASNAKNMRRWAAKMDAEAKEREAKAK